MEKKVLFVIHGFTPGQKQFQFLNYSRYLSDDFELMILFIKEIDQDTLIVKQLKENGVSIRSLNSEFRISISSIFNTYKTIKDFKPDIIHTQHPIAGVNARIAGMAYKSLSSKKVKIISEQRNAKKGLSKKAQLLEQLTFPVADLILCVSRGVEKSYFGSSKVIPINKFASEERKHYTFYNSIDIIDPKKINFNQKALEKEFNISNNEYVLISVASMTKQKGHKYLIKALSRLEENTNKDFKCLLVGTGPLEEKLKEKVENLNLEDKIIFTGYRSDVPKLLLISDVFILSSLWEGLPKALLEAMSLGVPPIATSVEGSSDVIKDGFNGLLVNPKDSEDMAEKLSIILKSKEIRDNISKNAKESINQFSISEKTKQLEKIYKYIKGELR